MKRFMSLFLILCSIMMLFGGHTNAYAGELTTPSGLAYSNIENEMDQFMEQYAAGLVSCEIGIVWLACCLCLPFCNASLFFFRLMPIIK